MTSTAPIPEIEGATEAEEFFDALSVPFDARVLAAHRLQVMKVFGLALEAWLDANPNADAGERRAAAASALREAHAAFAEDVSRSAGRCSAFGPPLVSLGKPR